MTIPLYRQYPALAAALPRLELAALPTPVQRLGGLCRRLGRSHLYVKRDDVSGPDFGGNKVRKLEFLLAAAARSGARTVVTVGGAGSNHALATAFYARQIGLRCAILLFHQPNSRSVRRNLLMDLHVGARMHVFDTFAELSAAQPRILAELTAQDGVAPFFIPGGGSSPLGAVGFVNAGLELGEQVLRDGIPRPAAVYVAMGTMGTAAGLLLGLRLAGLDIPVVAVRVVSTAVASEGKLRDLTARTNQLLHDVDPSVPIINPLATGFDVRHEHFGADYGVFTEEAVTAVRTAQEADGLELDGTYTGKAFAAFLKDAGAGSGPLLFWLTRNSRPLPPEALAADFHTLPPEVHRYFTEDVQPLDRS